MAQGGARQAATLVAAACLQVSQSAPAGGPPAAGSGGGGRVSLSSAGAENCHNCQFVPALSSPDYGHAGPDPFANAARLCLRSSSSALRHAVTANPQQRIEKPNTRAACWTRQSHTQRPARRRGGGGESALHLLPVLLEIKVELPIPSLRRWHEPPAPPSSAPQSNHRFPPPTAQQPSAYHPAGPPHGRHGSTRASDSSSCSSESKMRSSSGRTSSRCATSMSTKTIFARVRASTNGLITCRRRQVSVWGRADGR